MSALQRFTQLCVLGLIFAASTFVGTTASAGMQTLPFEEYLKKQEEVSIRGMLRNISPSGAAQGAVIASPSRHDPDYFFHWVRDAGLVMDVVVRLYKTSGSRERVQVGRILEDYVDFSRRLQLTKTLTGLGEPKFHADGRAYNEPWGRPQNDSPALRALSLTRWAIQLLREGKGAYVDAKLYSARSPTDTVIKADLEYVSHEWRNRGFDLWEEISGNHFYTRAVQRAALEEGAELARLMKDPEAAKWYIAQAAELRRAMEWHWDAKAGRIRITLDRNGGADYKHSGLDTGTLLGVLHAGWETGPFSITDERVLATAQQLEQAFQQIYPINKRAQFPGTAIGRYPEDVYYGGNPWVLTTAAYAEMYYRLATVLQKKLRVRFGKRHMAFFRHAFKGRPGLAALFSGEVAEFVKGTVPQQALIKGLRDKADEYLKRIQLHGHADGSLSEQFRRDNGYMTSAQHLTWSYASFLTAAWARK